MSKSVIQTVIAFIAIAGGIGGYFIYHERVETHELRNETTKFEKPTNVQRHGGDFEKRFQPKLPD